MAGGQAHLCAPQTIAMAQFSAGVVISSLAKTTIQSYNKVTHDFFTWVGSLEPGLNLLPATPLHITMYMGVLFNKGLSPATISTKLSALAFWHKLYSPVDPMDHFPGKENSGGPLKGMSPDGP